MKQYGSEADVESVDAVEENAFYKSNAAPYTDQTSGPSERTVLLGPGKSWANGLTNQPISPRRLILPFLLYCFAVGAVAVPKINVILALLCMRHKQKAIKPGRIGPDDICADPGVHAEMGHFIAICNLVSGCLCAISSPQLGRWSDRYGRKPFIAVSALGMFSGDVVSVIVAWLPGKVSVYWILLEFVVGGLTGAFLTTLALLQSYATDNTPPEQRASVFSVLHACMYLGLGLGPAAGALFVRTIGKGNMLSIFYAAGACHAIFICYVLIGIPESLPASSNRQVPTSPPITSTQKSRSRALLSRCHNPLSVLGSSRTSSEARNALPLLAAIDALSFGVQIGLPPLLVIFSEYQLHWKNFEASLFLSATNIVRAIVLAVILPAVIQLTSARPSAARPYTPMANPTRINIVIIRLSLLLAVLSNIGFAHSTRTVPFVISGLVFAAAAPVSALAQSSMTHHVNTERVGELFGAISLCHAVSRALIPSMMYLIYSLTLRNARAALFWALGGISGVTFLVAWMVER